MRFFLYVILVSVLMIPTAQAENPAAEAESPAAVPGLDEKQSEALEEAYALLQKISDNLDGQQQKHFYSAYSNYNMVSTIKMVQTDVDNAINECSKNNPDMENDLRARFAEWNEAVNPLMEEADANINNMVIAQDYADPGDIRKVFEAFDKMREEKHNEIDKIPVTTPEACEYLLHKMDETQEAMLGLLRATLITYPQKFSYEEPASGEEAEEGTK